MTELLDIAVLDHGKGAHKDLRFQVYGLTADLIFDSYYFALAVEPLDTVAAVRECIAEYLEKWGRSIEGMGGGETRVLPIDLSDEYVGCLRAVEDGEHLRLDYGRSFTGGWAISVNEPEQHFNAVAGFGAGTIEPLVVDRTSFLRSVYQCSRRLRNIWDD